MAVNSSTVVDIDITDTACPDSPTCLLSDTDRTVGQDREMDEVDITENQPQNNRQDEPLMGNDTSADELEICQIKNNVMELKVNNVSATPLLDQPNGDSPSTVGDTAETNLLDSTDVQVDVLVPETSALTMPDEASWQIALQVFLPFIVAGLGMVGAGLVLDKVQHWPVFVEVPEIFILVPALLGLKGNLEMTLASRLSTQANLGNMDKPAQQWKLIGGNLALTQVQAIVVGFLASVAAMVLGWIPKGKFNIQHAFLLCASSVLTAAFASLVLGTVMVAVVLLSRKCGINPDNVATPIAASLGDLTTLASLAAVAKLFYYTIQHHVWVAPILLLIFLAFTPLWCVISHENEYTHDVLYTGWTPVLGAMVISSLGGLILDFTVAKYKGIAVFQPVINGVGGNLVAVQASRLSTGLHMVALPGKLPEQAVSGCPNPFKTFFGKGLSARTARVLMLMIIPGHLIFMFTIRAIQSEEASFTAAFISLYLLVAVLQVALLLFLASWLVHKLWARGNDPDNFSIPYLTAMGDLLGIALLAMSFHILSTLGDPNVNIGE